MSKKAPLEKTLETPLMINTTYEFNCSKGIDEDSPVKLIGGEKEPIKLYIGKIERRDISLYKVAVFDIRLKLRNPDYDPMNENSSEFLDTLYQPWSDHPDTKKRVFSFKRKGSAVVVKPESAGTDAFKLIDTESGITDWEFIDKKLKVYKTNKKEEPEDDEVKKRKAVIDFLTLKIVNVFIEKYVQQLDKDFEPASEVNGGLFVARTLFYQSVLPGNTFKDLITGSTQFAFDMLLESQDPKYKKKK